MRHQASEKTHSVLRGVTAVVRIVLFVVLGVLLVMALSETSAVTNLFSGRRGEAPLVGLVAGHWQSDSGAVCADGLQEVDLNLQIARAVADALRAQGYRVEVLPEYSPKLDGYQAAVFLAIHNDSCTVNLSGFKVAAMAQGDADNAETELVDLLYAYYPQATGLKPHPDTITDDMRQYHALRQIAPETPGAIIECGFMGGDRALLTEQQGRVVTGIADGLRAFLRREQ
jgi:N-acetylmuramoyl-L-alanine amidase